MRSRGRLLLGSVLAVPLLYLFLRGVAWTELLAAFQTARPSLLLGVLMATLATYTFRAWRWGYLLAPIARVPFGRLWSVTWVGFMTGLLVPRAGEVVRPYLVARRHRIRTSAAFASIILERLFDLLAVILLFGLYLYVLPMPEAQRRGPLLGVLKAGGALAGLGAVLVLMVLSVFHIHADKAMQAIDRLLSHLPATLASPLSRTLRSFGEGLAVLQAPAGHLLVIAGQSVFVWLAIAIGVYLNNRAFGIELPFQSTFLILGFLTVGVAVPTPGMVGGFHEFYRLAVTQSFGVDEASAAAAGIALHALNSLPVLVLGLALMGPEGLTLGRVAEMTDEDPKLAKISGGVP
jgi:uncharacterized protein (TIRG00374 family)